jgi:putative Holliday junction resolvase
MGLPAGRLLGLDYGSRRIGIAVSDPLGITAQPMPAVHRQGDRKDIEAIGVLAAEYGVEGLVIGLPLLPDGNEGPQAARVKAFAQVIKERLGLPVSLWDERLTTVQAERCLVEAGVRREKRKTVRDSLSAVFILQSALDRRNRA